MKKTIVFILILSLMVVVKTGLVRAYIYEPEEPEEGDLYLDKKVSLPRENNQGDLIFKDNLSEIEEERYQKDQIVVFELRVKNVGDKRIEKTTVKDKFPDYVDFPNQDANWNGETHTYTYDIYNLDPGEEDVRRIEGRITTDDYICVINEAEAIPSEGEKDADTAKLCIGKKALGVEAIPPIGVNLLLGVAALGAMGAAGYLMKKK